MTRSGALVNLASRQLGAGVVAASDELFGEKEDLLRPQRPVAQPHTFGHKGQVVDGWETRRRRGPGHDFALIRLGAAGVVHGIVADTAHFTGNFPAECSVEACAAEGYPGPDELLGPAVDWAEIVPRAPLAGDTENAFAVRDRRRFTHLRLNIYPDGGVARLRVHGEVVPDPRFLDGLPLDLVAQENGGTVLGASDRFYSDPENLIVPGRARVMADGWETRRRREPGNDWVLFRLAAAGHVRQIVADTSYFVGNAPSACAVSACDAMVSGLDEAAWFDLLPRTRLRADTRQRFRVRAELAARRVTHVRLEIYPDGGLARLRLFGDLDVEGRWGIGLRWFDLLPAGQAAAVLAGECGLAEGVAAELARRRPFESGDRLDAALAEGSAAGGGGAGLDADSARRVRAMILGS
jgi:allantoicase